MGLRWTGSAVLGVLLLMVISGARAQEVRVGARAGPTFGFLNDGPVPFVSRDRTGGPNSNVRINGHIGAYGVVALTDRWSLQPEVLYVGKGGHFAEVENRQRIVERYRLSYLEVQVLGRRDIALSGPLSLHVVAGGFVDRALQGAVRRDVDAESARVDLLEAGRLRRWDVGGVAGMGVSYPVGGNRRLAITLRFAPGLRAVFPEGACSSATCGEAVLSLPRAPAALRHDVLTASLSYTVPTGQ